MPSLVIGADERVAIAALRGKAAASVVDTVKATATAERDIGAYRDSMRDFSIVLPHGYFVAYTHEIQPHAPGSGRCAHISISVARPDVLPTPEAVEMILAAFGMAPLSAAEGCWVEEVSDDTSAVNVVQVLPDA